MAINSGNNMKKNKKFKSSEHFQVFTFLMFFAFLFLLSCNSCQNNDERGQTIDGQSENISDSTQTEVKLENIWLGDISETLEISAELGASVASGTLKAINENADIDEYLPKMLAYDNSPRVLCLTVRKKNEVAKKFIAAENGFKPALKNLIEQAKNNSTVANLDIVRLDIIENPKLITKSEFLKPFDFYGKYCGYAISKNPKVLLLPDELIQRKLIITTNKGSKVSASRIYEYLKSQDASKKYASEFRRIYENGFENVYEFTTQSFYADAQTSIKLVKGFRVFDEATPEILLESAKLAGDYLTKAVRQDGSFSYLYFPDTDTYSRSYNLLRHAGTIYSMLEVYEITKDSELLEATKIAIKYLLETIKPSKDNENERQVIETTNRFIDGEMKQEKHVKLGGNGLAAIALSKYTELTDDKSYIPLLEKIGNWIVNSQSDNGEFLIHKQNYETGVITDFISRYYPGEALLGLCRINRIAPSQRWVHSAAKGAKWIINIRDAHLTVDNIEHDHWLLYSFNEIHRLAPSPEFITQSKKIVTSIANRQNRNPKYPELFGSYRYPPSSTPTATRSEGILAAYNLFKDFGETDFAAKTLEAAKASIKFQLRTQFRQESSIFFSKPEKSYGGFGKQVNDYEIRIDYVQHNISSILLLYKSLMKN